MGFRFRKSINLGGGFRINLSKSGVGYSWGTKGVRLTKAATGKTRSTFSIPGTGLSYTTESGRSSGRKKNAQRIKKPTNSNSFTYKKKKEGTFLKKLFFDRRLAKHSWLLMALLILTSVCNNAIPEAFREKATEKISLDMQTAYEEEVNSAYDAMVRQYEQDLIMFEEDEIKYEADKAEYEKALAANEIDVAKYDESFAQKTEEYNLALETYKMQLDEYNSVYEAEHIKAKEKMLKEGVPFSVKITDLTIQWEEIGDEWYEEFFINEEKVSGYNDTVTLKLNSNVAFFSRITEADKKPDVGEKRDYYSIKREDFDSGLSITHQVSVRENAGPNSGHTCIFEITYTLTPEEYTVVIDPEVLLPVPEAPTEPLYAPPLLTIEEPIAPMEPIYPMVRNVGIAEPDYNGLVVTDVDVYANNNTAKLLHQILIIISVPCATFLIIHIMVAWRRVKKEEAVERIEKLKQDFLSPEILLAPKYDLHMAEKYGSEEEKRVNLRFLNFLDIENQLFYEQHHCEYLKNKINAPYLEFDANAKEKVNLLICEAEKRIEALCCTKIAIPDPLQHLHDIKGSGALIRKSPFHKLPFSKSCKNVELSYFFRGSDVTFFESDSNIIFVFTAYYILRYSAEKLRFELLDYQSVDVSLEEGSTTKINLKHPEKVDVISVSWLYQTKSGAPDKRRADNPATYVIYDGAVKYKIDEFIAEKHYSKKDSAIKALEDAKAHIAHITEVRGPDLTNECVDSFNQTEYLCPEFDVI